MRIRTAAEDRKSHQFGVYLGIQPGVADEVDDPSLSFLGSHVQLVCQHAVEGTETRSSSLVWSGGKSFKSVIWID